MIAAVLAGGRARRFGSDKLLARVWGRPLLLYTVEGVLASRSVSRIVVVASGDRAWTYEELGLEILVDELGVGPIGGLITALEELGSCFIVAGDMPLVRPELVDLLVARCREASADACLPVHGDGTPEPLLAPYSGRVLRILKDRVSRGEYSVMSALRGARVCYLPWEEMLPHLRRCLMDVDTPLDLAEVALLLRPAAGAVP